MTASEGTVFFFPGLGFGAAAAAPIANALDALAGGRLRVVGIDPPGHDGSPDAPNGSVAALADRVVECIEAEADGGPFVIAAHSMGGKVAAVVTHRILHGKANVFGLAGLVLLAPSPLMPEPMSEDKRAEMLSWVDDGPISQRHASEFVAQNVAAPLGEAAARAAVEQLRRMSPLAWRRWLTEGSAEDLSSDVGVLDLPVVVLAGEDDDDLGASAQPQLLADVYPRARFVSLASTGHLLPYERAAEVADEIVRLWDATVPTAPQVTPEWSRLIASERTAPEARGFLAHRALADHPDYAPRVLSPEQLSMLRALADRLVPQSGTARVDLAARVDADLALGRSDGWRNEGQPADVSAYRLGLDDLSALWPDDTDDQNATAEQNALIEGIISGELNEHQALGGDAWNGTMRQHWFDDLRTDLTRIWLSHPASFARIGYDGFATSGPASGSVGYNTVAAGLRDPWEPVELGDLA
ncbi:Pimeloyl-ACP methyl ester carboxylesterase [Agreia bicolorata]|uniref:Pimeloyl-ACP methyl ester carboxylesterase n=1 Tax=Agreia bicolorata TaxID=110935 RepID=A0A1T4Y463_9MICO|nr:alpha/beta hydrolase [Agreia bicolorata]SKA96423.1 Pimeloyl-ACP methyl ester carboxylesterase [Agreia bicolorata]